ncbi:MAG TPA: tyrosine-protein phosphatase [Phycisphaerae bacterium]|nr:tyrosine-protein phosphatase [Phycisphaerae bacterium]
MAGWLSDHRCSRHPPTGRAGGSVPVFAALACLLGACVPPPPPLPFPPIFNFHNLDPGRAYRSGQPNAIGLTLAILQFNIRTVVNLKGASPGESWYESEKAVCDAMGVVLRNHTMDGGTLPPGETLGAIVETLRTAQYPILIHCQMGADRTGAISAIYRMAILGHPKTEALAELTPRYFHSREDTPCMDRLVEIYEPGPDWLAQYTETAGTISCVP